MTDVKGAVVHLDDLAEPRFSREAQQIRDMMATMAPDCPLDADILHAKAAAETGFDDFGDDDYRERLDVYLAALQEIPGLHAAGVVNFHAQLLQWLKNRLLLTDLLTRHPEIHDIELVPPIVIAGLPRTGTTHLHNLLAAAPTFRTMPYWESNEPFPLPAEAGVEPDPRRARMDVAVQVVDIVMPHFRLMHEMTTDHVHEEIQLLANDFSTMLFETLGHVPRWRDYYMAHDQTSHYEYLETQLKAMQFLRGGRRWLLKSPQHLEQLPVLNKVFPGVFVIFTHRDPAPVTLSMLAMITYSARMHRSPVPVDRDRRELGRPAGADARRPGPRPRHHPAGAVDRRSLRRVHGRRHGGRFAGVREGGRETRRRGAGGDRRLPGGASARQARHGRDVARDVRPRRE